MTVRISGEGQYELPDEDAARFNELANRAGVILPPRDITFEEARGDFTGEGLIPD